MIAVGTCLGPYEVLSTLGAGGMGEVYKARDTRLDRLVAIKVLRPGAESDSALERFQREARAASALNHPNICTIYDVGTDPPFLAMELLDGETLQQMRTGRPAFAGPTGAVISSALLHDNPVAPREARGDLPARLDDIIVKALEKNREERYQTAADLRADLRRLKRDLDSHPARSAVAAPPTAAGAGPPSAAASGVPSSDTQIVAAVARRHRRGLAAAAAVLVLVVAGAAYFATRRRPPPIADAPASLQDLEVVQLTTSGNAERPAISPDGKFVAYIQRDGNATSLWVRQTATGSNVQIVPPQPNATLWAATVTPDGGFVDFVRQEAAQPPALWRVPFLGGTPKRLIDGVYSAMGWSPDGQRLAFVRISERTTALVVADRDGGHERTVATRRLPAAFNGVYHPSRSSNRPAWSADGRVIAVMGHTDNAAYRVVLVDVASGAERLVPIPGDFPDAVAWLNAASFVLNPIATGGTLRQLWRLSYPGGQASRLTNDLSSYLDVSVTGDAGSLVTARSEARMSIWIG